MVAAWAHSAASVTVTVTAARIPARAQLPRMATTSRLAQVLTAAAAARGKTGVRHAARRHPRMTPPPNLLPRKNCRRCHLTRRLRAPSSREMTQDRAPIRRQPPRRRRRRTGCREAPQLVAALLPPSQTPQRRRRAPRRPWFLRWHLRLLAAAKAAAAWLRAHLQLHGATCARATRTRSTAAAAMAATTRPRAAARCQAMRSPQPPSRSRSRSSVPRTHPPQRRSPSLRRRRRPLSPLHRLRRHRGCLVGDLGR